MPPILEQTIRPVKNRISLTIPKEFGKFTYRVVMIPVSETPAMDGYDFSDIAGKLEWKGDAVAEQRRLRDEW